MVRWAERWTFVYYIYWCCHWYLLGGTEQNHKSPYQYRWCVTWDWNYIPSEHKLEALSLQPTFMREFHPLTLVLRSTLLKSINTFFHISRQVLTCVKSIFDKSYSDPYNTWCSLYNVCIKLKPLIQYILYQICCHLVLACFI